MSGRVYEPVAIQEMQSGRESTGRSRVGDGEGDSRSRGTVNKRPGHACGAHLSASALSVDQKWIAGL